MNFKTKIPFKQYFKCLELYHGSSTSWKYKMHQYLEVYYDQTSDLMLSTVIIFRYVFKYFKLYTSFFSNVSAPIDDGRKRTGLFNHNTVAKHNFLQCNNDESCTLINYRWCEYKETNFSSIYISIALLDWVTEAYNDCVSNLD